MNVCTHAVLTIFAPFYTADRVYCYVSALPVFVSYFMCFVIMFCLDLCIIIATWLMSWLACYF